MRKFKLAPFMLIPAIFGLSSCTLPSWLSWLPFGDKEDKEEKKEESKGKSFKFTEAEEAIAEYVDDVVIPEYKCSNSKATCEYDSEEEIYLVFKSSKAEMDKYATSLTSAGWFLETDSYGDYHGTFGGTEEDFEPGDHLAACYIGDYTEEEGYEGILVQFYVGIIPEAGFPSDKVAQDLAGLGVTEQISIPAFSGESAGTQFVAASEGLGFPRVVLYINDSGSGTETLAAVTTYGQDLLGANFTDGGDDGYGNTLYVSPGGQFTACAWPYAAGYVMIDFELVSAE